MNLNEIFSKKKITEEEYIYLKKVAYGIAANYSGKEILKHMDDLNIKEMDENIGVLFYVATLFFPNDLAFINEYDSDNINRHSTKYLSQKFKMPNELVKLKIYEITNYNTRNILANNPELKKLAQTLPHFEENIKFKKD